MQPRTGRRWAKTSTMLINHEEFLMLEELILLTAVELEVDRCQRHEPDPMMHPVIVLNVAVELPRILLVEATPK